MTQDSTAAAPGGCHVSPRDRRNQVRLAGICLLWAILFLAATYLIRKDLVPAGPLAWIVAAVPALAAVFVLLDFSRFLRQADELQRLIQLQALALGFGGGYFVICSYLLFERLGAPEASGIDLVTVLPVLYVLGVLIGQRRYR